jgi:3-keto-disaccharide hydrolase
MIGIPVTFLLVGAAAPNALTEAEQAEGWKLLFDGQSLAGWGTTGKAEGWAVEDGAIACSVQGGKYLYTQEQFGDFVLSADFKFEPKTNSGIFVRWSDLTDPVNTGVEMQVLDTFGRENPGTHDCGAIYDLIAPSKQAVRPAGEWNTAVITCKGSILSVQLNGDKIAEMDVERWSVPGQNPDGSKNKFKYAYKDMARSGHIGLQDHGGRVWYRNIKIKPL